MSKFVHNPETPMVFFFDSLGEVEKEILEWFVERQALHAFRTLVNAEREKAGCRYEITFYEPKDAIEFKLKFV